VGVSVCEPKVTVAPEATLSAAIVSGKEVPPAGAAIGEKLMMAGAPDPVVEVITVKVALFETTDALATETLMVPEEETSFEGTITDIVSHCAMLAGQLTGAETDEGESVSLPKRRIYVTSRPVPVIPSVKLPLPAGTLVGEIERMAVVVSEGGTAVPPPHPRKEIEIPARAQRRTTLRSMFHRPPAWLRDSTAPASARSRSSMIEEREAGCTTRNMRCRTIRFGCHRSTAWLEVTRRFIFWLYGETKFRYQGCGATGAMRENPFSIGKINGPRAKSFRIKAAGNPPSPPERSFPEPK